MKGNFVGFFVLFFILFLGGTDATRKSSSKTCRLKKDVPTVPAAGQQSLAPSTACVNGAACAAAPAPSSGVTPGRGAVVQRPRFPYGEQKIRGVNLGGWFVLEPWVNPSMFNQTGKDFIVDEWTYGYYQTRDVAQSIIEHHWDTWITEDDFEAIAQAGLNHVRIPMPYWSVPTANTSTMPFLSGSWSRLLRAVSWASKYDLSVIIDIHGAPGSQNGYDNSGLRLDSPQWQTAPENVNRTLQVFSVLLNEFGNFDKWGGTVGAIEALNEPAAFLPDVLPVTNQYWHDTYGILRDLRIGKGTESADGTVDPNEIKMVIMDGFIGVQNYKGFLAPPQAEGVMMDTHCYQIFNPDQLMLSQPDHITQACAIGANTATDAVGGLWTFVGEWSASPTDCTPWINGRFIGSDWVTAVEGRTCDGLTGAWQTFSDDFKDFLAQYFEAQVMAYEQTQGWIYWFTETVDEWSYSKGIEGGWIPANISDMSLRRFPDICS
ncbi:glycoside hydrolase family 5 protein [Tulasnella calospora MUT 4182]|uniref:Glycoside hydrolase family 5 protein n=1 Tax=Tulasnella calospora MUT 4182 TaxID=1051891 RepID=A0A0C3LFE6_9AGAM|nr:glycoside hydrolase family 5 protein [Tulasnella calospora MUT 4182]